MDEITDKVLLFLFGTVFLVSMGIGTIPVVSFLAAISISSLITVVRPKYMDLGLMGVYFILCLMHPDFCIYLPLIMYDMFYKVHFSVPMVGMIIALSHLEDYDIMLMLFLAFGILTAFFMKKRTLDLQSIRRNYNSLRDTITEHNLALKQKNKDLMDKQDYEIYLATLRERNRIAREIHDNVGHILSRAILQVGAIGAMNTNDQLKVHIDSLRNSLDTGMSSIRESVHDLHDDSIDLKVAIGQIVAEMSQFSIDFEYDMENSVPKNVKVCFIAIIKEAFSNILKHSDATKIFVKVREHPGLYQLSISDNGTVTHKGDGQGIGLLNMKDRVEAFRGTFRIDTKNGFQIFISISKADIK